jgi:predicted RNase H-like nuclease (RuvC/YqgF family)
MTMTTWCALAVVLSFANPPASQSTASKAQTDADMKELASYTLTMETLNKVDRAMRAAVVEIKKDPRFAEAAKLEAELKALKKKEEPTEADDKRQEELERRLDALKDNDAMNMNDAQTISQMAAKIEKFAPMMAGLRSAGLTAREYSKFMMAVLQAGMTAGMQKAGMLKEIPPGTNPANVKFMLDHEEDFKKMQAAWAEFEK